MNRRIDSTDYMQNRNNGCWLAGDAAQSRCSWLIQHKQQNLHDRLFRGTTMQQPTTQGHNNAKTTVLIQRLLYCCVSLCLCALIQYINNLILKTQSNTTVIFHSLHIYVPNNYCSLHSASHLVYLQIPLPVKLSVDCKFSPTSNSPPLSTARFICKFLP